jgi:hypothetical protein
VKSLEEDKNGLCGKRKKKNKFVRNPWLARALGLWFFATTGLNIYLLMIPSINLVVGNDNL